MGANFQKSTDGMDSTVTYLRMKLFALFSVICSLAAGLGTARAESLKPGDPAPDFSLQGSDGKIHKLADYKGKKPVVIAWFPKAFTGGCTAECKSLRANSEKLKKFDVAYFTASCDSASTNKAFAESLSLDYPILSDPDGSTARAFGVTTPERKNPQRWTYYIGKDGKILYVDQSVKTGSHGEDIAGKLKELGVAEKK
jgi:peroxiredoxin Q/BCP